MNTITHGLTCVFQWLWNHKAWTAIGTTGAAISLYSSITAVINRRLDAKIFGVLQERGTMGASEIAGWIGEKESRVLSRLWDLLKDDKIGHSRGINERGGDGKHFFYPLPSAEMRLSSRR